MHRDSWRFVRNNGCLDTGLLEPPKYRRYGIYIDFRFEGLGSRAVKYAIRHSNV